MRRTWRGLCVALVVVALSLAAAGSGVATGVQPAQWVQALGQAPSAVNQRPRETPPTTAPEDRRDPATEEGGWIGWALLVGIPALIIAWVFGRRRRFRRDRDQD